MNDTGHWWNDTTLEEKLIPVPRCPPQIPHSPGTEPGPLQASLQEEIHNDTNTKWYELSNSCEMGLRFINNNKHKLHVPDIQSVYKKPPRNYHRVPRRVRAPNW